MITRLCTVRFWSLSASAVLLATAAVAQSPIDVVVSATKSGATELALGGSNAFRTTSNRVVDAKGFALDASSTRVALWSEVVGSSRVPYYAILLDGLHASTVVQADYDVMMRRERFDPAQTSPDFSSSRVGWGGETFIVQFVTQPLIEYQDALRKSGAIVYDYFPNHCHLVRMSAAVKARVAALPFVRWIGAYHGEYKLEPTLLARLNAGTLETQRYNVQVFERGLTQKPLVAGRIESLGGRIDALIPNGFIVEATLTPAQLANVAGFDEVASIDAWSPPQPDMNIVRALQGVNTLESQTGFSGQGVHGEMFDTGVWATHVALQHNGGILFQTANDTDTYHGTSTTGIVFGDGTADALGRGMLPSGNIVFASFYHYTDRYALTAELVDPSKAYQCVFQSNSWGDSTTTSYTSKSFEMDDIIFLNDILICQSQSNTGTQSSRPQAWAKNVVSIGGINHFDDLNPGNDSWGGASIGPAEDGSLKPDLANYYDSIQCPQDGSNTGYQTGFNGTSAATPICAGHFGLFFQMWHNGVFGNAHSGATVFANRPHFTLAKAALINTAMQYNFTGTNSNLTRTHQGWGVPNVQTLYDLRNKTFFVDQTNVIDNLQTITYHVVVAAGEPDLKATLVYRDPAGIVSASQHRKNDLSLEVTDPNGTTVYWGNNGLNAGTTSTSGGVANTKDTVENVFVHNPSAGSWTIAVVGSDINTDIVPTVPGNNADFALWVTGGTEPCNPPTNYCAAKTTSIGTTPAISSSGSASFAQNNFALTLAQGTLNKSCIVFWGDTQFAGAFHGGTLCVHTPLTRGAVISTDALGAASYPFPITNGLVGQTLNFQWWMRDPGDAFGDGLSNALSVTFCN